MFISRVSGAGHIRVVLWCAGHATVSDRYRARSLVGKTENFESEPNWSEDAVTVLCDAFQDYPVMRYVLGLTGDYDRRLRTLIGYFVSARVYRNEPVLGVYDRSGTLSAVALVSLPGEQEAPEAMAYRPAEVLGRARSGGTGALRGVWRCLRSI